MISELFSSDGSLILALCIGLTLFCLVRAISWALPGSEWRRQRQLRDRLQKFAGPGGGQPEETLLRSIPQQSPFLDRILEKFQAQRRLQLLLLQADVKLGLTTFLLLCFFFGSVGWSLGMVHWGTLGGLIGGGLGLLLPYKILVFKKKRRTLKIEQQLADALDMMSRSMRAGHAFPAGLQLVAKELPNPIGGEFNKTYMEYTHGMDMSNALLNLCSRVELRDLGFFTTAVLIQRETGGNLTEILEKISALIRERFKLRNQIKALTAEGRFSGLILILLPPLIALILYFINPKYEMQLIEHPLGRTISMVALAFQALGMLIIRKIVNIKV